MELKEARMIAEETFRVIATHPDAYNILAMVSSQGEMVWQDKEYVGYGKHKSVFYCVANLQVGDAARR